MVPSGWQMTKVQEREEEDAALILRQDKVYI